MIQDAVELPDWVPRERFPFTSRYVELQGNRVHYVDEAVMGAPRSWWTVIWPGTMA